MFANMQTTNGLVAPLRLNQFEFQRRFQDWFEKYEKPRRLKEIKNDVDTRRGLYYLRNIGVDGLMELDRQSRATKKARENAARDRIVEMMTNEAVEAVRKEMGLSRREAQCL